MNRSDYELAEALDIKLRNAINEAEEQHDDPYIIVVMNENVVERIQTVYGVPNGATDFKVNQYPTFISDDATMQVIVLGEGSEPEVSV